MDAVADTIQTDHEEMPVYTSGANNIFRYPELSDSSKASELISIFEEKNELAELLMENTSEEVDEKGNSIQVYIGQESPMSKLRPWPGLKRNDRYYRTEENGLRKRS